MDKAGKVQLRQDLRDASNAMKIGIGDSSLMLTGLRAQRTKWTGERGDTFQNRIQMNIQGEVSGLPVSAQAQIRCSPRGEDPKDVGSWAFDSLTVSPLVIDRDGFHTGRGVVVSDETLRDSIYDAVDVQIVAGLSADYSEQESKLSSSPSLDLTGKGTKPNAKELETTETAFGNDSDDSKKAGAKK